MRIGEHEIGPGHPVAIIAEIGPNHAGSLDLAKRLIRAAKDSGADGVKFQCYEPSCLTMQSDHPAYRLTEGPWAGRTLWDLYSEAQTPFAWFPELAAECKRVGIPWFASVFSPAGLAVLEAVGCPAYKIASAEVLDLDLVRAVAATGKPVILSDGMATDDALRLAFRAVREAQGRDEGDAADALGLHCVSEYPAGPCLYALAFHNHNRPHWQNWPLWAWGVSDHTLNDTLAVAAVALGACMVEKHLMLPEQDYLSASAGRQPSHINDERWLPLDYSHSITPSELARYVRAIRDTETMMVNTDRKLSGSQWRRRLVFARDLPAGHVLTTDDVTVKRCGEGAEPWEDVTTAKLPESVRQGDPVDVELLDESNTHWGEEGYAWDASGEHT